MSDDKVISSIKDFRIFFYLEIRAIIGEILASLH